MSGWVVVAKGGVAYRNTPKYTDRVTVFRGPEYGSVVEAISNPRTGVDEGTTWIETSKGWLPICSLDGVKVCKKQDTLTKSDISTIRKEKKAIKEADEEESEANGISREDLWLTSLEQEDEIEALEDTALVVAAGGSVAAVQHTGETLWQIDDEFKTGKCISLLSRAPILGGIKAVYAAAHGRLLALAANDGRVMWALNLTQMYKGPCTMCLDFSGERLFAASQGHVMGICANTGRSLWVSSLARTGYDVVTLLATKLPGLKDQEQLFVASRGRVFCFSGVKGKIRWDSTMKLSVKSFMCLGVHEDRLQNRSRLLFSMHGRIGALDTVNGRVIWEIRVAKLNHHSTLVPFIVEGDTSVYAVAGLVLAIHAKTGQPKWEKDLFGSEKLKCEQSAICFDRIKQLVYVAVCQHVVALELETGKIKWSIYSKQTLTVQPTLYLAFDDLLYVGGNGHVRCIDTLSGTMAKGFDPHLEKNMKLSALAMTHPTQGNQDHSTNPVQQSWAICASQPDFDVTKFKSQTERLTASTADDSDSDSDSDELDEEEAAPSQQLALAPAGPSTPKQSKPKAKSRKKHVVEESDDSEDDILHQVPSAPIEQEESSAYVDNSDNSDDDSLTESPKHGATKSRKSRNRGASMSSSDSPKSTKDKKKKKKPVKKPESDIESSDEDFDEDCFVAVPKGSKWKAETSGLESTDDEEEATHEEEEVTHEKEEEQPAVQYEDSSEDEEDPFAMPDAAKQKFLREQEQIRNGGKSKGAHGTKETQQTPGLPDADHFTAKRSSKKNDEDDLMSLMCIAPAPGGAAPIAVAPVAAAAAGDEEDLLAFATAHMTVVPAHTFAPEPVAPAPEPVAPQPTSNPFGQQAALNAFAQKQKPQQPMVQPQQPSLNSMIQPGMQPGMQQGMQPGMQQGMQAQNSMMQPMAGAPRALMQPQQPMNTGGGYGQQPFGQQQRMPVTASPFASNSSMNTLTPPTYIGASNPFGSTQPKAPSNPSSNPFGQLAAMQRGGIPGAPSRTPRIAPMTPRYGAHQQ